ncbi:hypothetical protein ACWGDS_30495 [Streptomyces sp. NPDC055059]|uniref:hypothetical protein n=1 Tax=Streptomyces sp. NPDC127172 TaxID=3345382 RepID=UPI003635CF75
MTGARDVAVDMQRSWPTAARHSYDPELPYDLSHDPALDVLLPVHLLAKACERGRPVCSPAVVDRDFASESGIA